MTTDNLYEESWALYKAHSESFLDDIDYYINLCKGKQTLELFAGYGRITNRLNQAGIDVEAVELEPNFSKHIEIALEKIHTCNVLAFTPAHQFERIIAGYNSFCLLLNETDVIYFFNAISRWLRPGGIASLSYYDHNAWGTSEQSTFNFKNEPITYTSTYDLSRSHEKSGLWIDEYKNEKTEFHVTHKYPVKLYDDEDIRHYIKNTSLSLENKIINYNKNTISEPGWIEYVFKKNN